MEQTLAEVELQLRTVADAIVAGEPQSLTIAATSLRLAALALAQSFQNTAAAGRPDPGLKRRVRSMARRLAQQRESLIRRAALVDRSLNALVPATRGASYAPGASAYGTAGRQTGSFRVLSA
ncbi:MAG: hypothetical protein WCO22_11235 [Betaproteobacteria bacterium]|jgi:hypothetical protein